MTTIAQTENVAAQSGAADAAATSTSSLANSDTFLKLLVAQIKNQDPMNPTDGVQFVSQLAQFSELEQIIGMRTDVAKISTVVTSPK